MPDAGFNIWWGLVGLIPLLLYIVLVLREMDPLPATIICVVLGAIINSKSLVAIGTDLSKAMGSFLGLVGLIIMLGRGLGEILSETKVAHTLVYKIMYGIGINTQRKAMLGIMMATMVIVALLGTMAGGVAIIAPIVNPIAAAVGLTPAVVAVLYQSVGEEALTLGPFTPPVVTLIGLTKIDYGSMLLTVAIPIAVVTLLVTWFMAQRIQRTTKEREPIDNMVITSMQAVELTPQSRRATSVFLLLFILLIVYGIFIKAATPYVITVMLGLSFAVGMTGGMKFNQVCKSIIKGMAGNVGLFLLFLLLELFIGYVELAGGFKALTYLLMPLVNMGGKVAVVIAGGALGAFGISGAVVAELMTLHKMFSHLLTQYGVSMMAWAVALIVATRVTNFIIPGSNMVAMMGFAQSNDLKSMIRNGYVVAIAQTILLVVYAFALR
ncbi:MAG: rane protein [Anaerosporomusa subterranea]|jgi:H+/gluconate symporter-like permease|nr:rane protein [Anaerosporomusa subterranea]